MLKLAIRILIKEQIQISKNCIVALLGCDEDMTRNKDIRRHRKQIKDFRKFFKLLGK